MCWLYVFVAETNCGGKRSEGDELRHQEGGFVIAQVLGEGTPPCVM